jgi:hypothetical protein
VVKTANQAKASLAVTRAHSVDEEAHTSEATRLRSREPPAAVYGLRVSLWRLADVPRKREESKTRAASSM